MFTPSPSPEDLEPIAPLGERTMRKGELKVVGGCGDSRSRCDMSALMERALPDARLKRDAPVESMQA